MATAITQLIDYRTTHLPLSFAYKGKVPYIIPNRAMALFTQEDTQIDTYITRWVPHIINADEEFSAPTLAYNLYNRPKLWWFICLYNGILFPTRELTAGREIRIPDLAQVQFYLSISDYNEVQETAI